MKPYYDEAGITIYHGDSLEVLPQLDADGADLLCTDPPYFVPATHYSTRSRSVRSLSDLSILEHFFRSIFTEVRRVLTPRAFAYVFCDGQSYPVMYVTAYAHFRATRPLVWDKLVSINGYSWRHQHELILYAESDESPAVPTGDGDVIQCRAVPINDREHLAEKPVDLLARLIRKSTDVDKCGIERIPIVLDPFGGSFRTAEACIRVGRRFIGIEREERFCEQAAARLSSGDRREVDRRDGVLFGADGAA